MPYDFAAPQNSPSQVRLRAQPTPHARLRSMIASRDEEVASIRTENVEPMLLVHQEQVETFRLVVAAFRRTLKALVRPYAG
jgi:hypothetical protein